MATGLALVAHAPKEESLRIHKEQSHPARHPIIFLPASGRLDRLSLPFHLLILQSIFHPPRRYQSLFESAASQFCTRLYASEPARHLIIARAAPLSPSGSPPRRPSSRVEHSRRRAGGKNRCPLPEWCLTSRDYRPSHRLTPKSLENYRSLRTH